MIILPPRHVYPIEGCSLDVVLQTKAKYQRHYTEKHLSKDVFLSCQVFTHCKISCSNSYDAKAHIFRVNNTVK